MMRLPSPTPGLRAKTAVSRSSRFVVIPLLLSAAVGFNGCSTIKPTPLAESEIHKLGQQASVDSQLDVVPLAQPLTLDEAIARALKYNLNQRARLVEQALAVNVWKAGKHDLLPRALASAGYTHRNKELITRSTDSVTGQPSLANPSISSERESILYDLGLSWSVIDFTLSYYNAKQNADRILIAAEHRRKAMHALTRDVTIAFWRMAGSQKLLDEVRSTIAEAEAAVAESAKAGEAALRAPVDALRYQRQLLENIRLLSTLEKDFATARATLANLVNLPLDNAFVVVEPEVTTDLAILDVPVEHMEELALLQNADLREQIYNERIAVQEVRKTIAKLIPDLSFTYNLRYTTDSYVINDRWNQAGIVLSQNLGNLLSAPARKRLADGGVELVRQRRVAAQMALLAQVHIARLELAAQHRQLVLSERIAAIDRGIRAQTASRESAETESKLGKIASDTAAIVSLLRRYQTLAEFQAASGALQSTLGMEIDLDSVADQSLEQLTASVAAWQNDWRLGRLPATPGFGTPAAEAAPAASL